MAAVVNDPVAEKRARISRLARVGKRVGYAALGVSVVAFFAALVTEWSSWAVATCIVGLVVSIVVLPVPIVVGYGVRAADRDDRERGRYTRPNS